ncbi:MAG: flagellar protein FlaG [Planctomycetes bacterium]|nr:flagellar protein FlaG [Planctomycetota bacterium]
MQPLAPLTGNAASAGQIGALLAAPSARDLQHERAPGRQRPLEMLPQQVEEPEASASGLASRYSEDEANARLLGERAGILADTRSRIEKEIAFALTPRSVAVTYELYPELRFRFQRLLVDRLTDEVLREIPPESFVELAIRYHEHVGRYLDVLA